MSKQISNKDLATLKQAYFTLGVSLDEFKGGDHEMGVINLELTKSLLSSLDDVKLEDETPKKRSGTQDSVPPPPEPPKSNEAAGYIPPALLRTPSNAEIYAHTMDRVDNNK